MSADETGTAIAVELDIFAGPAKIPSRHRLTASCAAAAKVEAALDRQSESGWPGSG